VATIWSDEKIEELKVRWDAGESCAEIAASMRMTRNMVIGKAHRLHLSERRTQMSPQQLELARRRTAERNADNKREARRVMREQHKMEEPVAAMPAYAGSLNIPFADLREYSLSEPNMCRFIADEPPAPLYRACGTETQPGESYCDHCKQTTLSKSTLSQPERALYIRMGVRKHLRELRKVAHHVDHNA